MDIKQRCRELNLERAAEVKRINAEYRKLIADLRKDCDHTFGPYKYVFNQEMFPGVFEAICTKCGKPSTGKWLKEKHLDHNRKLEQQNESQKT